jgi:hypothetical protein
MTELDPIMSSGADRNKEQAGASSREMARNLSPSWLVVGKDRKSVV